MSVNFIVKILMCILDDVCKDMEIVKQYGCFVQRTQYNTAWLRHIDKDNKERDRQQVWDIEAIVDLDYNCKQQYEY